MIAYYVMLSRIQFKRHIINIVRQSSILTKKETILTKFKKPINLVRKLSNDTNTELTKDISYYFKNYMIFMCGGIGLINGAVQWCAFVATNNHDDLFVDMLAIPFVGGKHMLIGVIVGVFHPLVFMVYVIRYFKKYNLLNKICKLSAFQ